MNELGDTGIGTDLTNFFSSINNVLNSPSDVSTRNLAVLQGQTLTGDVNQLAEQVQQHAVDLEHAGHRQRRRHQLAGRSDRQSERADRQYHRRQSEQRGRRLDRPARAGSDSLSNLISINVQQQTDGEVAVYAGGNYWCSTAKRTMCTPTQSSDRGTTISTLTLEDTNSPLALGTGRSPGWSTRATRSWAAFSTI